MVYHKKSEKEFHNSFLFFIMYLAMFSHQLQNQIKIILGMGYGTLVFHNVPSSLLIL